MPEFEGNLGEMDNEIKAASRWKKPLIVTGIVGLLAICGFSAATSRTDLSRAASEYEKNKADAQQQGLYFTSDQVKVLYDIPESENGAKVLTPILPLVRNLKLDKEKVLTEQMVAEHVAQLERGVPVDEGQLGQLPNARHGDS